MASKRYRSSLIFATMVLMLASCGKDKAKTPAANTKVEEAVTKKTALPVKLKPKPPKLQLEVDDFIKTRVLERCALKGKESKDDARTIAIDQLAGRPYQPQGLVPKPAPAAPAPKVEKEAKAGKQPANLKGTVRTEADSPNGPPKQAAASGEKAAADTKAAQSGPAVTPGGRMALTKQDDPLTSKYDHDLKAAAKWKPYQDRIEKKVETCLWAPELGLVDEDLVNRYVSAFVEITCLQDKHRDKAGQLDTVAHARAAVEVFERNQFTAPQFAQMGIPMGRFDSVQAKIGEARTKNCPDKRLAEQSMPAGGEFIGTLKGSLTGTIKLVADHGKLKGTIILAPRGKAKKALTMTASGTKFGQRVHINASEGQNFLRLDCRLGAKACEWSGQVGFKPRKGTFVLKRPPPPPAKEGPKPPASALQAAPAPKGPPTVPAKTKKQPMPPPAKDPAAKP